VRNWITFNVSEAEASGVHDYLGGEANALTDLLDRSRRARSASPVQWCVPITAVTVYRIESLHRLAEEEGIRVDFDAVSSLCDEDRDFFQDYVEHRLIRSNVLHYERKLQELASAAHEAKDALIRVLRPPQSSLDWPNTLRSVVVIGAYGGDHIGDAAILGGVLNALNRCHNVQHATVMSYRPRHTSQLVWGLSTPVTIAVEPYEAERVDYALDEADALFIAGGPIFDAPRILAKHIASVHSARVRGRPFFIERVGIGLTWRLPSSWLARGILKRAKSISVRSNASAHHPLLSGLSPQITRDPAFDYLETRANLDRLRGMDKRAVDALTAGAERAVLVGINLRPTHDRHAAPGKAASQPLSNDLVQGLSKVLIRFAANARRPVSYIFFPMNAVQHGMSDLAAAFQLHRAVGNRVDLRVWEGNPGVDGVLYLLQKLDLVIAMRLHAAIFSMSQGLPVLGLDYFSEKGGKLTELFCDSGRSDWVRTIGTFEEDWLVGKMEACIKPPIHNKDASIAQKSGSFGRRGN
jgi:polysaccharide pyruvyl transferase WcaK-like protein